jgi:proteasome lid subunit RPN8/RPN11
MEGYIGINKVLIPHGCIEAAYEHMRKAGQRRVEGVALFAGKENGEVFQIERTIIPKQEAMSLEEGWLYAVDGDELHKINVWLYENKMSLMAQIHSHPSEAYHSQTDDAYPIVATVGGLSIVVPNFARGQVDINKCAVYRLLPEMGWVELSEKEKNGLIELI